jgi:4a-hydroxytetrahydrobiopterin dehydratase
MSSNEWQERARPVRLEKRYVFPDYANLRDFLDRAADISEREVLYPDMGFGRDYVNVTIYPDVGSESLSAKQRRFAEQLDTLFTSK